MAFTTFSGNASPSLPVLDANFAKAAEFLTGTFTPNVSGSATAGAGAYAAQKGYYTKIANIVFFRIHISWTAHTGTGNIAIGGLPFVSSALTLSHSAISIYSNSLAFTSGSQLMGYIPPNSSGIAIEQAAGGVGAVGPVPIDTAVSALIIAGHYQVD